MNQLLCGVHIAVAAEALAYAEALGLDAGSTWEVLRHGAAASFMLDDRGARMVDNPNNDIKSTIDIFVKDMGLVTDAARAKAYPAPLASAAEQLYLAGRRAGLGRADDSSVIQILRGTATAQGAVIAMRALVLQEFGRMAVEERDTPTPKTGEVLIAVTATGICGSDVHGFTGENGRRVPGQIMGHESVGKIAGFGPDTPPGGLAIDAVVTFNPVVVTGQDAQTYAGREQHSPNKTVIGVATDIPAAFADYVVVPIQNVVALPADMPISHGALIEPLGGGGARRPPGARREGAEGAGHRRRPDRPIRGAGAADGGVADIVVSEVDENRRRLCARIGATVVNPKDGPLVDQVRATFGRLADVTIDAVGITPTIADALNATAFGGSVCLVGMGAKTLSLDAFRISTEERSLVGSFTYSAQDFRDAAAWIATAPAGTGGADQP